MKAALGGEWGNAELAKPFMERHPILQWYNYLCEIQAEYVKEVGKSHPMPAIGAIKAYMHLAYDLYALEHNVELQRKLINRLKNKDNFLGARYEVFVAATMIRAGFDIEFEDEDDRNSTHCEFTATYRKTGRKFSVEAKCRSGGKLTIGRLLNGALAKAANHARVVFINMNIPNKKNEIPTEIDYALSIVRRDFEWKKVGGKELPNAYLFVTNYPWDLHLAELNIGCSVVAYGFQLPEFMPSEPISLRQAITYRAQHIEMHDLLLRFSKDQEIPSTFDGEIPSLAFNRDATTRLLIGDRYEIGDSDGMAISGVLTDALVLEDVREARCLVTTDDGKNHLVGWPLTDAEFEAWRQHPDTFFGRVEPNRKTENLLEFYDFILDVYQKTPKETLLRFMEGSPDIEDLRVMDQVQLASIYSERMAIAGWSVASKPKL